jgi:hypothetical protein
MVSPDLPLRTVIVFASVASTMSIRVEAGVGVSLLEVLVLEHGNKTKEVIDGIRRPRAGGKSRWEGLAGQLLRDFPVNGSIELELSSEYRQWT